MEATRLEPRVPGHGHELAAHRVTEDEAALELQPVEEGRPAEGLAEGDELAAPAWREEALEPPQVLRLPRELGTVVHDANDESVLLSIEDRHGSAPRGQSWPSPTIRWTSARKRIAA